MAGAALVADVGGTHARVACLAARDRPERWVELPTARFAALAELLGEAVARLGGAAADLRGGAVAVAVAGPVRGDEVKLTNAAFAFAVERTRRELGLARLLVVNDFEALALAVPGLAQEDLELWRAGEPETGAPRALLGPGTGLGMGGLVPAGEAWIALPGEGGHCDLAAADEHEWRIVERLRGPGGHVAAEDLLSGPGLAALRQALVELAGAAGERLPPEEVGRRAAAGSDASCVEAVQLWSGWLGAVAGDLVLTLGARGGLYLAGGALAGLGAAFDRDRFLARFGAKGRMSGYLAPVPVFRVTAPDATLRGAASALRRSGAAGG